MHLSCVALVTEGRFGMADHAEGVFEVTSWSEEQAGGLEGTPKVTIASIGQHFTGGIEADTIVDTVMTYRPDGTAAFVGYQRVLGRLGDKTGSFVLQGVGTFDGKEARTALEVVDGSATDELAGLRGKGISVAPMGSTGTYSIDFEL